MAELPEVIWRQQLIATLLTGLLAVTSLVLLCCSRKRRPAPSATSERFYTRHPTIFDCASAIPTTLSSICTVILFSLGMTDFAVVAATSRTLFEVSLDTS